MSDSNQFNVKPMLIDIDRRGYFFVHQPVDQKQTKEVVALVRQAQSIAVKSGMNILQPGLIKELIIAETLGHDVYPKKHGQDAVSKDGTNNYEYLTCKAGGSFQFDRMFKSPPEKRVKSMHRITRNKKIYCVVFTEPLQVQEVWDVPVETFEAEVERQLDASQNEISHVSVPIKWVRKNGIKVEV